MCIEEQRADAHAVYVLYDDCRLGVRFARHNGAPAKSHHDSARTAYPQGFIEDEDAGHEHKMLAFRQLTIDV